MNVIINRVLDHRQKNQHKKESRHCGILCIEKYCILLKCLLEGNRTPILRTGILRVIHYTTRSKYVNQITVLSEVK